ncbi:MAG: universal stress protein [Steroidobacteraceae bacterium]
MDRIADILVIVDPTVIEQPAVAKAHALAKRLGAGIQLLACDTKYSREARVAAVVPSRGDSPLSGDLQPLLDEWAEPLRGEGIDVATHVITGDPLHECVLSWLRNSPADMVVKDTHHHSLAKRTLITNTDWNLIRACPLPLLLTKPAPWHTPPVFVAAVDPLHADDALAAFDHRILDVTATLAKQFGAQLHAMHAYFPATLAVAGPAGMPPMVGVSAEALAAESELKRSQIWHLVEPYGVAAANLHVGAGVAAHYLPSTAAECHADLVVMGAIARGALKRAFIGSTAERVLETLPCDILVVKPRDFAKNLPF